MPRVAVLWLVALAAAGAVVGCGGEDEASPAGPRESTRAGFPDRKRTLLELRGGLPGGPVLSPTVTVVRASPTRVAFRLLDPPDGTVRPDAAALYVARLGGREHWVAEVVPPGPGPFVLTALVRDGTGEDARLRATNQLELRAGDEGGPPDEGERAVRVHTDIDDSREPPSPDLHRTDLADVLGRRPVVLVFASPGRCPTRVCAQVVDAAAQVHAQTGVETIHQETFLSEDLDGGIHPQARAWRLPTPAWTFVIDARGRVSDRFEGAVSVAELRRAVERVGTR